MEAGGKDCEDETLQTAFKKLRVDVESLSGAVSICDALTSRGASRAPVDGISGAKPKLGSPKDTWHCCTRKTSRGTSSRSQRRRRSKSPILQPPRFTYCSSAAVAPPGGCLKQQRLAEPLPAPDEAAGSVSAERRLPGVPGRGSPVLFGVSPSYEPVVGGAASLTSLAEPTSATPPRWAAVGSGSGSGEEKGRLEGAGAPAPLGSDAADFRALSQLHSRRSADAPCFCSRSAASDCTGGGDPGCCCRAGGPGWNGVEVYSFTGVRECIHEEESRTLSAAPSSSPRSCSEQARVYVDDITIEDLSGYMEYYLYIPKKMSHMAEMMYT